MRVIPERLSCDDEVSETWGFLLDSVSDEGLTDSWSSCSSSDDLGDDEGQCDPDEVQQDQHQHAEIATPLLRALGSSPCWSEASYQPSQRFTSFAIDLSHNHWTPSIEDDEILARCCSHTSTSSLGYPESLKSSSATSSPTQMSSSSSLGLPAGSSHSQTPSLVSSDDADKTLVQDVCWAADSISWGADFINWNAIPNEKEAALLLQMKKAEMEIIHARAAEKKRMRKEKFLAAVQRKRSQKLFRRTFPFA